MTNRNIGQELIDSIREIKAGGDRRYRLKDLTRANNKAGEATVEAPYTEAEIYADESTGET